MYIEDINLNYIPTFFPKYIISPSTPYTLPSKDPFNPTPSPPQFMLICIYGNATRLKIQTSSEDKHTKYLE